MLLKFSASKCLKTTKGKQVYNFECEDPPDPYSLFTYNSPIFSFIGLSKFFVKVIFLYPNVTVQVSLQIFDLSKSSEQQLIKFNTHLLTTTIENR